MEIYDEDMALPRLFLTQSGARVIGAGNLRSHRDPQTGEQGWPAMGCYNPDCPERDADGEPFAFLDNAASDIGRHCPACRELRDVANETPLDRNRWARCVRPHELPETAARRRELTEQRRQDPRIGQVVNADLDHYKIPTCEDVPEIVAELLDLPDPEVNTIGAKGLGEPPIIPLPAAVANAVADALGRRLYRLPLTPDYVLTQLQQDEKTKGRHP